LRILTAILARALHPPKAGRCGMRNHVDMKLYVEVKDKAHELGWGNVHAKPGGYDRRHTLECCRRGGACG
jgi:hypothetical protein